MPNPSDPFMHISRRTASRIGALVLVVVFIVCLVFAFRWASDPIADRGHREALLEAAAVWLQAGLLIIAAIVAYRQWRTFGSVSRKRVTFDFIAKIQMDREILEAIAIKRKAFIDAEGASADGRADKAEWLARLFSEENSDRVRATFGYGDEFHVHVHETSKAVSRDAAEATASLETIDADISRTINRSSDSRKSIILTPRNSITTLLNVYEIISIGIFRGALDEEMMALWWQTTIVKDYFELHKAIHYSRARGGNQRLFENFERLAMRWYDRLPEHERPAK